MILTIVVTLQKYVMNAQSNPIASIVSKIRGRVSQKYRFDQQFSSKKWDGLWEIPELARYSIIVGYTKYYAKEPRILDLGCGEGVLLQKYSPTDYAYYAGIDYSKAAIEKALSLQSGKAHFGLGDINKLQVEGSFDIIIFNESLYYLKDPLDSVRQLSAHLNSGGIFIVSMHKVGTERDWIWAGLDEALELKDRTDVINGPNTWTLGVYKVK